MGHLTPTAHKSMILENSTEKLLTDHNITLEIE